MYSYLICSCLSEMVSWRSSAFIRIFTTQCQSLRRQEANSQQAIVIAVFVHLVYTYTYMHMYVNICVHIYITKTYMKVSTCKEHPICLKHFLKSNRSSLLLSNTFIDFLVHSWDTLARSYF